MTPQEYARQALAACEEALAAGEDYPDALDRLSQAVYDLKLVLGAEDRPRDLAEAEEVLMTLRYCYTAADLDAAGVMTDLVAIRRRLAR